MSRLPKRRLGRTSPEASALGFGAMGLSASYGKVENNDVRFSVLDRAFELGATFWDTSDVYADNEDLLKLWFQRTGKRAEIFLATKFGVTKGLGGMLPSLLFEVTLSMYARPAKKVWRGLASVKEVRLNPSSTYCDNLDTHTDVLQNEGKIGAIGLSEVSATTIRRAEKVHHIDAVQLEYSPFALDIESSEIGILKTCRELGITVVAYSPLGRGFLTGQIKSHFEEGDFRKNAPRYSDTNFPKNLKLVEKLRDFATRKGCTTGQLSLAWLLAQGPDIITIP